MRQGCTNVSIPEPLDDSNSESDEDTESNYTEHGDEDSELVEEEVITDDFLFNTYGYDIA